MFKKILAVLVVSSNLFAANGGSQASVGSADLSSQGLSEITRGSAHLLHAGGQLSIATIQTVGDVTYLTLKAAGQSTTLSLRIASQIARQALIRTGQILEVTAIATGNLLCASGYLVAFVPNEIGKSLIYSATV